MTTGRQRPGQVPLQTIARPDPRAEVRDAERDLLFAGFAPANGTGTLCWSGHRHGRTWKLIAAPRRRTRYVGDIRTTHHIGWSFSVEAATPLATRLQVLDGKVPRSPFIAWLHRRRGHQVFDAGPAMLEGAAVVTVDPAFARALLAVPTVPRALAALLRHPTAGDAAPAITGHVVFGPGLVFAGWQGRRLDAPAVSRLLQAIDHLAVLVQAAEALPPPTVTCRPSALERLARERPWLLALTFLLGGTALLGLVALMLLGLALGVAWLLG